MKNKSSQPSPRNPAIVGITLGILMGIVIGIATNNVTLGIILGVILGFANALVVARRPKN